MRRVTTALLLSGCFAAACATPIELPKSFVELRDDGVGFRAMTSDDARLWVRTMEDPSPGGVTFWVDTLKRDLVERRGYEFLAEGDTKNADGEAGRWLELSANHNGERVDYLIAVWARDRLLVSGKSLRIVEFAAKHDVYEQRIDDVRAALATVTW